MSARGAFNRPAGHRDETRRVEAAGIVDAKNASTNSLENAQTAFPTAPTRIILNMLRSTTVTYVPGQMCYLGRRPVNP